MANGTDDQLLEDFFTDEPIPLTAEELERVQQVEREYGPQPISARPVEAEREEPPEEREEGVAPEAEPRDPRVARIPVGPTWRERSEAKAALRRFVEDDLANTPGMTEAEVRRRMDELENQMGVAPFGHAPTISEPPSIERIRELLPENPDDRPAGGPHVRQVPSPLVRKVVEAIDAGAEEEEIEELIDNVPLAHWPDEVLMPRGLMQAWGRATGPRVIDIPRSQAQRIPELRWAHRREAARKYEEMIADRGLGAALSSVWAPNVRMSLEEAERLKLYLPDAPEYDGWATAVTTLSGSGAGILSGSGATRALLSRIPGGTTSMTQAARSVAGRIFARGAATTAGAARGGATGATGGPVGIAAGAVIGGAIGFASGKVYEEMSRGGEDFWKPVPAFGREAGDDGWYFALPAGLVNLSARAQVKLGFGTQNLIPIFLNDQDAARFREEIARSRPTESFEQIVRELQLAKEQGLSDEEIRTNLGPTFRGMIANNAWVDLPSEMRLGNLNTDEMRRWARLHPEAADDASMPGLARVVNAINDDRISDPTLLNSIESIAIGQLPPSVYAHSIPSEQSMVDAVLIAGGITIAAIEATGGRTPLQFERAFGRLMLRTEEVDGQPQIVEGSIGRVMRVVGAATEFYAELPIPYITPAGRDFQRTGTTMIRSPDSSYMARILANIETGELGFARHMTDDALARGHERGSLQYDLLGGLGILSDWMIYWERPFIAAAGVPTGMGVRAYRVSKDFTTSEMALPTRARMMLAGASPWIFKKTLSDDVLPVQAAINRLEDLISGEKTLDDVKAALARLDEPGALNLRETRVAEQVRDRMESTGESYRDALNTVDRAMDADVWTFMRFLLDQSVQNAIRRGDKDILKIIPSKWHDSLYDVLRAAGVPNVRQFLEDIGNWSSQAGRFHLSAIERLMTDGDPGTQALRMTPEYKRVQAGINALVEAGDLQESHAAWMLGLMEQNAWRLTLDDAVTEITDPVDFFRYVEIRRRGKPAEPPTELGPEPIEVEGPEPMPVEDLLPGSSEPSGVYKFVPDQDVETTGRGAWESVDIEPSPVSPDEPLVAPTSPRSLEKRPSLSALGADLPDDVKALGYEIYGQPGRRGIFGALGLRPEVPLMVRRLKGARPNEGEPVGALWLRTATRLDLGGFEYLAEGGLNTPTDRLRARIWSFLREVPEEQLPVEFYFADVLERNISAAERKIVFDDFGDQVRKLWAVGNEIKPVPILTIIPGRASEVGYTHISDDLLGLPTTTRAIETPDGYTIVLAEAHPRWAKERVEVEAPPPRVEEPEAPPTRVEEPEEPTVEEVPAPRVEEAPPAEEVPAPRVEEPEAPPVEEAPAPEVKVSKPEEVPDKVRSVPLTATIREKALELLEIDLSKMKKPGLVKIIGDLIIIPNKTAKMLKKYTRDDLAGAIQRWAELYGRYPILTGKDAPGPVEPGATNLRRRLSISMVDQWLFDGHLTTAQAAKLHVVMDRLPSEWFERTSLSDIEHPEIYESTRVFGQTRLRKKPDSQLDDAAMVQALRAIIVPETRLPTKLSKAATAKMAALSSDELFGELAKIIDDTAFKEFKPGIMIGDVLEANKAFMKEARPYFVEIAQRLFEDPEIQIKHGWSGMRSMLEQYSDLGRVEAKGPNSVLRMGDAEEFVLRTLTDEFIGFHDKDVVLFHILHEIAHTLIKNILTDQELSALDRAFNIHRAAGFKGWHRREEAAIVSIKDASVLRDEWAADMLASNLLGHRGFDELIAAIEASELTGADISRAADAGPIDLDPGVEGLSTLDLEAKVESLEDGRAIADWLSENADNPSYRAILKHISPHLDNVSVRIYRGGPQQPSGLRARHAREGRPGWYSEESVPYSVTEDGSARGVSKTVYDIARKDSKTGKQVTQEPPGFKAVIWLRSASLKRHGISSEIVVHELLHSATKRRQLDGMLERNKDTVLSKSLVEFEELRTIVKKELDQRYPTDSTFRYMTFADSRLGTENVGELISWGLTNKRFQEILQTIKIEGDKTAFSKFVDLIKRLLGIPDEATNALTEVIRLTEDILGADLEELSARAATVQLFSHEVRTIFKNMFARIASVLKRTYGDEGIIKALDINKDVADYFTGLVDRLMSGEVDVAPIRRIYERRSREPRTLHSISSSKRMIRLRDVSGVEPSEMGVGELDLAVRDAGFIDLDDAKRAMRDAYLDFDEYERLYAASREGMGPEKLSEGPSRWGGDGEWFVSGAVAAKLRELAKRVEALGEDIMARYKEGQLDGIEELEAEHADLVSRLHAAENEVQTGASGIVESVGSLEEKLGRTYVRWQQNRADPKARLSEMAHKRSDGDYDRPMSKAEYDGYWADAVRHNLQFGYSYSAISNRPVLKLGQLAKMSSKKLLAIAEDAWQVRENIRRRYPAAENRVNEEALAAWNLQRIMVNKMPAAVQAALELIIHDRGGPRGPRPEVPKESIPPKPFEIFFHGRKGAERGFFSFDFENYQSLVNVLKYGDWRTLLQANALMLSKFMGERWAQGFINHFDHATDSAGRVILTARGELQAAKAFEWYIRTTNAPSGGLKRYFDQMHMTLQDYWAKIRGRTAIIPPEVRQFFDRFLRPDLRYEGDAIKLGALREHPVTFLKETAAERLTDEKQLRTAKRRAFWSVNLHPDVVRSELGIPVGATEVNGIEILSAAVGYIAAENAKKLLGPGRIFMMTPRTMVPETRRKLVLDRLSERLHAAIGQFIPTWSKTNARYELDPAQQAGIHVLLQDVAKHPMGNIIPDRLLESGADLSWMAVTEWASIAEAIVDVEAGVGARRAHYSEHINPSQAYALWNALKSGVVDISGGTKTVTGMVNNLRKAFKLDVFANGNLGPVFRIVWEKRIRSMELAPREILKIARDALSGDKEISLQQIYLKMKNFLTPPVSPSLVDDIVGTINLEHVDPTMKANATGWLEFLREFTSAEKKRHWGESTEASSALLRGEEPMGPGYNFAPTAEGMSKLEYLLSSHLQLERLLGQSQRWTEQQQVNILQPIRRYAMDLEEAKARGVDGSEWLATLSDEDLIVLGDALGKIEISLDTSHKRITQIGEWLMQAAAGERDASILEGTTEQQKAAFYKWFYEGNFTAMFDYLLEFGREAGHSKTFSTYDINEAMLNMIIRLRAYELMGQVSKDLARYGLMTDLSQLGTDMPLFDAVTEAYTGFRHDSHVDEVQFYIQMQLNYRATGYFYKKTVDVLAPDGTPTGETRDTYVHRAPPAPRSKTGKSMLTPERAEYAKSRGWARDPEIPSNFHEMQSYTSAMEILDTIGVKASTEKWERVLFHDGSEHLMPAGAAREYFDALERVGELGTARGGAAPAKAFMVMKAGRVRVKERPTGIDVKQYPGAVAKAQFGKTIDDMMTLFPMTARHTRMGVTTGIFLPNPAYYLGVGVGAFFQLYEGLGPLGAVRAVASHNQMKGALMARMWREGDYKPYAPPIPTKKGELLTVDLLFDEVHLEGLKSSFIRAEAMQGIEADLQKELRGARSGLLRKTLGKVFDQERLIETSTAIDNYFRLSAYLDARVRGMNSSDAAKLARKIGFDYAALTEFEKKYMRSLILFYSYFRKNMDLFWDTLLTNPERLIGQMRLIRGVHSVALEEDPEVVLRKYAMGRLPVWFKDAAANQHVQNQWMYIVPPLPYHDAIMWPIDLFDALKGDNEALRGLVAHVSPWWQAPFVFATQKDIFWGKELELYNRVPTWLVEWDLNMTGGMLVKDLFDVQLRAHADPSKADAPGMERWYHARNAQAWWVWRNLMQFPTAGRSMDTISSIDRANIGPVEWINAKTKELGRGYDPASVILTRPSDFSEDTMTPRPGLTELDEFLNLVGIRPLSVMHGHISGTKIQQRQIAELRRAAARARLSDPGRYPGGILELVGPGFVPPK